MEIKDRHLKALLMMSVTLFIIFTLSSQAVYAVATTPSLYLPKENSYVPYYQLFLKWNDVPDEHHYLISVRDLYTQELLENRTWVNQNSNFYSIQSSRLVKGRQYRWALASVDATGMESWSPARIFTVESGESHVFSGGFSSASHLDFWVNDNGNTSYGDNILQAGGEMWNGVTSDVFVHRDWNTTSYEIGIIRSSNGAPGTYGYTARYNGSTKHPDDMSATSLYWNWCEIYIYENSLSSAGFDDKQKRSTVAHEMGHALSLGHTAPESDENWDEYMYTTEIMDSGKGKSTSTTDIDRTHLRIKWGWH